MPYAEVELHEGATTPQERRAISDAIHQAMIEVLGIPEDDRFHFFHELPVGNMFHDDVIYGVPRTDRLIFVTLSFNHRTAEQKTALFNACLAHLEKTAGWKREEAIFRILETDSENWWAEGRIVNPATGLDERMDP